MTAATYPPMSPPNSGFMPRAKALSLEEHREREEAEVKKQAEQVERTARLVQDISTSVEAIRLRQEELEKRLASTSSQR